MNINIRSNKVNLSDDMKSYTEKKIGKIAKYFDSDDITANVVIKENKIGKAVEVTVPTKNMILRAEVVTKELNDAIDTVSDKLERQIRKNKTRMKKKAMKTAIVDFNLDFEVEQEPENKIVKRKILSMKPMDEEEAILQMELIDHDFFVYRSMETDEISVIYKRKDGNYGVIETK